MNILLTVDESPYSEISVETLKAFRLPPETKITVVTVVPEHAPLIGALIDILKGGAKAKDLIQKAQEQKADELLAEVSDKLRGVGFKVETAVRWGKPADQILAACGESGADLVVIGAKGSYSSSLFPLGTIAQKVIKHAGCSVLVVREEIFNLRRILLAIDGSRHADEAAHFLEALALTRGTQVVLATVIPSHVSAYARDLISDAAPVGVGVADIQAAEERRAQDLLQATRMRLDQKGYEILPVVLRGDPAQEILAAAERFSPDLIAIGARGTAVEPGLLGSVAHRIVRYARSSVLIVRPRSTSKD